jgi:hypothetical protein
MGGEETESRLGERTVAEQTRFEPLEERRLLAFVAWDGGGTNEAWGNAANWTNDTIPTAFDQVVIDQNLPATPIIISGNQACQFLNSPSPFTKFVMDVDATFFLAEGATVAGAIEIIGGRIIGGDPNGPPISATLTVGSIATDRTRNGPSIENMAIVTTGVVINPGDTLSFVDGSLTGALNVLANAVFESGNGWEHYGLFSIATGATGTFASNALLDSLTAAANSTINFIAGGVVNGYTSIAGTVYAGAELNFMGTVDLIGGYLGAPARFRSIINWDPGTIAGIIPTVQFGATLNIRTGQAKFLACDEFRLEGITNWIGTGLIGSPIGLPTPTVINRGAISITSPGVRGFWTTEDHPLDSVAFANESAVSLGAGSLQVEGFSDHAGNFSVASGATLSLHGSLLTAAGFISGAGDVEIIRSHSINRGSIAIGGSLTVFRSPGTTETVFETQVVCRNLQIGDPAAISEGTGVRFRNTLVVNGNTTIFNRAAVTFGRVGQNDFTLSGLFFVQAPAGGLPASGLITINGNLNVPGGAVFNGGTTRITGTFTSPVLPVFTSGRVIFETNTTLAGNVLFNGSDVEFNQNVGVADAEFRAGSVTVVGAFTAPVDPDFTGATVVFRGEYAVPRQILVVTGGSVTLPSVSVPLVFNVILLSGSGAIAGPSARTQLQGPVLLHAVTTLDWQGGTLRNLDVTVLPTASFTAGGGQKVLESTFPDQGQIGMGLRFPQMNWSGGGLELRNNVSLGSGTASIVEKSGPGDLITTTTIPPQGGGQWAPGIYSNLFRHSYPGTTRIEGSWSPASALSGAGEMQVLNGEVTLADHALGGYLTGTVLHAGRWTIGGALLLPGAAIESTGAGVAVALNSVGALFPALDALHTNGGSLTFSGGRAADLQADAEEFVNLGTLAFLGGVTHECAVPIHNSGLVRVDESSTLRVVGGIRNIGQGLTQTGAGSVVQMLAGSGPVTVLEHSSANPFTGGGRVEFIGNFEQVFHANARIDVAEMVAGDHTISGLGELTVAGQVRYDLLAIAPGTGATRIALGGSLLPGSAGSRVTVGGALTNSGFLDAEVSIAAGGTFSNGATGVFEVRGVQGPGVFTNAGELRAAPGAPVRLISSFFTNTSTRPIRLDQAHLHIRASITNLGTLAVTGDGTLSLDGDMVNSSAVAFDGTGAIEFAPGASIQVLTNTEIRSSTRVFQDVNELSGTGIVTLAGHIAYKNISIGPGGTLVIASSGSLTPAGASSSIHLDRPVTVHGLLAGQVDTTAAGVIDVRPSGVLDLGGVTGDGVVNNSGRIRNTSGANRTIGVPLNHSSALPFLADGSSSITLADAVNNTGALGIDGTATLHVITTLDMTSGSITGAGDVRVYGTFRFMGGALLIPEAMLVIDARAAMIIDHNQPGVLNADRDIENAGLLAWARGSLAGAGSIDNNGIFVLPSDEGDFSWSRSGSTTARVVNQGTIIRSGAGGSQSFLIPVHNLAGGIIRADGGALGFLRGGAWDSGAVVEPGAALNLASTSGDPALALDRPRSCSAVAIWSWAARASTVP